MTTVVPAIIPKSFEDLKATLELVSPFTHDVQIDIVDGKFVPFTSWPYTEKGNPRDLAPLTEDFVVEVDLMIHGAEDVIEEYVQAGVERVVVHLESALNLKAIFDIKERFPFELGFSIDNDTNIRALTSVLARADYVQLMGIAKIGSQGQPFDERVLTRIQELKDLYPAIFISIDGSVNAETLPRLRDAGADRFVAGSAIIGADDPHSAFASLSSLVAQSFYKQDAV